MADAETDKRSQDDEKDQTNVEAESSKLLFEDKDETEVNLGLSSASTDISFEQESSAETEVEKDINEVHSEDQLQKEGVSEDADLLIFADTLLKNLGRKKEKGKVRIKWNGECTALKDFVTLALKYEGAWKCRTDKRKDIYTFNEKDGNCTITWWSSNGPVNIQGSESKPTTEKNRKDYHKDGKG